MADFWSFQAKDFISIALLLITCWAVYYGPIRAVKISLDNEARSQRERTKTEIFTSLMKTRNLALDPGRVASLNLIQVVFGDSDRVILKYKEYIKTLVKKVDGEAANGALQRERGDAFVELTHEIASELGYKYDKKEIQDLAYAPAGWATDQETARKVMALLADVLEMKRPIGFTNLLPPGAKNPFPPPPDK